MSNQCPPVVQIPGVAGSSAFAYVTANFTVPAIGANVAIQLTNTAPFIAGENIIIAGPGNFQVVSVDSPVQITAKFLGLIGDVAPATIISIGAQVSPTGASGLPGVNGYTITVGAGQTVLSGTNNYGVVSTGSFAVGENVIIAATGGSANFRVISIPTPTTISLLFLAYASDVSVGTAIPAGSVVSPAGSAGQNAFTTLTAPISAIPAVGSPYTVAVLQTAWMATGEVVVIAGPAHFRVTTIISPTSAALTFLGYVGDLPVGGVNPIPSGATVSPSGVQPFISTTEAAYSSGAVATLSATPALLTFGGANPVITLPNVGTWVILAQAVYAGTVSGGVIGSITTLLHRTNNTAADVPNSTLVTNYAFGTASDLQVVIPLFIYTTTTAGDIIQLRASQIFTSGSTFTTALQASIVAFQIA